MKLEQASKDGIKCSAFMLTFIYEHADDKELREEAWAEIVRRLEAYDVLVTAARWSYDGTDISKKWYK